MKRKLNTSQVDGTDLSMSEKDVKIAVLEAKVDHLIGHVKELTLRVRANEKVVASVSLLGVIAITIVGAGYFAPKAEACSPPVDGSEFVCPPHDGFLLEKPVAFIEPEEDNITETPDYYRDYQTVTVYDTRDPVKWDTGSVIQRIRDWEAAQNRTPVDESISNAIEDLDWTVEE